MKAEDYEFISAKITVKDELPELPEGEVDVTDIPFKEVNKIMEDDEIAVILKRCKCYRSDHSGPVTLYWKLFAEKKAACASTSKYDTLDLLEEYLLENRPLVYSISHNTIFDKYMLRVFTTDMEAFEFRWYDNLYNKMMWKRKGLIKNLPN
jgi:hypothetical protein